MEVKPYFEINKVLEDGVFYAANQLYGVSFKPRTDLPVYQPDVKVYTVYDKDGSELGLMYFDYWNATTRRAARGCPTSSASRSCSAPSR